MIDAYSLFYYVKDPVASNNFYLNFDEGSGELTAEIESGDYTPTELAVAVGTALNEAGTQAYSVSFNRQNRKITISAAAPFDLLISTGVSVGSDIFSLIGFTGSDLTGQTSYEGNLEVGDFFEPQYKLQDWVSEEDLRKAVQASVNKSANGIVEVVSFGQEKFFEFNMRFITDIDQGKLGPIKTNLNGVQDARDFLRFCITKKTLEFMPDINDKNTFKNVLLEKTDEDSQGLGYRLKELYTSNLPYYFETGKLVFRVVE